MALDELTLSRLAHHWTRRQHYLKMVPPERKAADQCVIQMDEVLDDRPRGTPVESDAVYDEASEWLQRQGRTWTVNTTGEAERVDPPDAY